jgi:predicted flap endonuclease-1-like 5' DNA nuclease
MAALEQVEGIGTAFAGKLRTAGVKSSQDLLKKGASARQRKGIADRSGIAASMILGWVNHVDLFRVKGVGEEYSDLLEACGVDTVPELSHRDPVKLHARLVAVNEAKKLVRQLPTPRQVANWIKQAKRLPRIVTY